MRTYYEKVLNGMQRPILLVAVSIVALLSASGIAMGVTSTEGRNEGHAVKRVASDGLTPRAASPTSTVVESKVLEIPYTRGSRHFTSSVTFPSLVVKDSAAVTLNGFRLDYTSGDHSTDVIEVDADFVRTSGRTVFFAVDTTYQDNETPAELYNGYVVVTVIANVQ